MLSTGKTKTEKNCEWPSPQDKHCTECDSNVCLIWSWQLKARYARVVGNYFENLKRDVLQYISLQVLLYFTYIYGLIL